MLPGVIAAGIGGAGSLFSSLLGAKQKNDQQNATADAYNKYLQNYQGGQNNYLNYLKGVGPQTTTSNQQGQSATDYSSNSTTNPFVTAQFSPLVNKVQGLLQSRLNGPGGLPAGYAESAIRNMNNTYAGATQAATNQAARFGAGGPQATAASIPLQQARAGQIADFRANLPLTARALQDQDMQQAATLASIFGKGQTQSTTGHSVTDSNSQGSTTGPAPIAGMGAFLPPGPQATGAVDPGLNMLQGGLSGANDLQALIAQLLGKSARDKAMQQGGGGNSDWLSGGTQVLGGPAPDEPGR